MLDAGGTTQIRGRIFGYRSLGGLAFAEIFDGSNFHRCVFECPPKSLRRGAVVIVTGVWRFSPTHEFLVEEFEIVALPQREHIGSRAFNRTLEKGRIEALMLRTQAVTRLHRHFQDLRFTPVTSPKIVSPWAVGQTGAFSFDFYGMTAYLSLTQMIHHQMIMIESFPNIYEIGTVFRAERPSSAHRLAEFTIVDYGAAFADRENMINIMEGIVRTLIDVAQSACFDTIEVPTSVHFDRISYQDVMKKSGVGEISGHQFPSSVRRWMNDSFSSFVWILDFPDHTRPFFVKSVNGRCLDAQLWYRGRQYLAAGGERETDRERVEYKIAKERKDVANYRFYLDALSAGAPNMIGIGMGLERTLATWTRPFNVADFSFFPRFSGQLSP